MIYLDNAATSLHKPKTVADAVYQTLVSGSVGNAARGSNEASLQALRLAVETRSRLGELFGYPHPNQVAFSMNATDSLNMAIEGLLEPGDHVITTQMEHNSVLRPLYRKEKEGVDLTIIPCDEKGRMCLDVLAASIRPDIKALVCTHASNLTGNVNDLEKLGALCRENGTLFLVDAAQSAGLLPIDMEQMHIDVLCFSGHKGLLGPQGMGGICVREGVKIKPFRVGGTGIRTFDREQPDEMPTLLEAGTLNMPGIAGLRAGVEYILDKGTDAIWRQADAYASAFYEGVKNLPGVRLYGDFDAAVRTPVVTLNLKDYDSAAVGDELMQRFDIAVRSGGHCAPLMHHALGTGTQGAVRFSFSHFNTMEEVQEAVKAMRILAWEG